MSSEEEIKQEFEKKDVIYSATMGVCTVSDVTKLSADRSAPIPYYVLRSYFDKTHVAYIPVEGHNVELRHIITESEAIKEFDILKSCFTEDENYKPDMLRVGELAYAYRITPDELLLRAGAKPDENGDE